MEWRSNNYQIIENSNLAFENTLKDLDSSIFSEDLKDIIEVTYSYDEFPDGSLLNLSLFKTFLWNDSLSKKIENIFWYNDDDVKNLDWDGKKQRIQEKYPSKSQQEKEEIQEEKKKLLLEAQEKIDKKLQEKISIIKKKLAEIKNLNFNRLWEDTKNEYEIKRNILIWLLEYNKKIIQIAQLWLPFEIEKWLYSFDELLELPVEKRLIQDENTLKDRINEIEALEAKVFWWKISENAGEKRKAIDYLKNELKESKKWTSEERRKFAEIIESLEEKNNKKKKEENISTRLTEVIINWLTLTNAVANGVLEVLNKFKEIISWEESLEPDKDILKIEIEQNDYIKIFNLVFKIRWLNVTAIKNETRNSIYDNDKTLEFPTSDKFKTLTLERIIKLILHENMEHYSSAYNNELVLWNWRWAGNLKKWESLATIFEEWFKWKWLKNIKIAQNYPKILLAEKLEPKNFITFLKLNKKVIDDDTTWEKARFIRIKRNYPFYMKWSQHKDTTYTTGIDEIVWYIETWEKVFDLLLGKVAINDINKVKKLVKIKWLQKKLKQPLLIGELIYFILKSRKEWKKISQEVFIKYLQKKYSFITDFKNIDNIPELSFTMKRYVAQIIKIIESSSH